MDQNARVGGVFAALGIADILLAQVMARSLPPVLRNVLRFGGAAMIVLGVLMMLRVFRLL
jgi:hypothetical protein